MAAGDLLKATIDLEVVQPRLQQKYERSLRLVRDAQRLVLAPHPDADGFAAAAQLVTGFRIQDRRWNLLPIVSPSRSFSKEDLVELRRIKPDIITFLDVTPHDLKHINLLKQKSSIVIIDHHRVNREVLDAVLLGINPEPDIHSSAAAYTTGKLAYDLVGAGARADLALVSIMGDRTTESWRSFLKQFTEDEIELAQRAADRLSVIGSAIKVHQPEPRPAVLKRQRSLFTYLTHAKTLPSFLKSIESTKTLRTVFEEVESGVRAVAGKAQISLESGVEFVHVPIKSASPWSVIKGVLSLLELVVEGQTAILSEPWSKGVELRVLSNDPDIDAAELLKGFGGGHSSIAGGHSAARTSEVVDLIRERWSQMKQG